MSEEKNDSVGDSRRISDTTGNTNTVRSRTPDRNLITNTENTETTQQNTLARIDKFLAMDTDEGTLHMKISSGL